MRERKKWTRRSFLWRMAAMPVALVLAACSGRRLDEFLPRLNTGSWSPYPEATNGGWSPYPGATEVAQLPPTPACDDGDDDPTPAQTEGSFYTPDSPQRTSLIEAGMTGIPLLVTGHVLSTNCEPIPQVLVDFWHCDNDGVYDNVGYKLRGHQFTDDAGRFSLETILPGVYPGRTRHIHVKVQAANQPVLTTQLYFPNEPENARDGIYNPVLEMAVQDTVEGKSATFDFVLAL